ncbi:hypothetical protein BD309DRAFT_959617 [Dichomitus squalens]|uniref:Uncharacterized protein n=1 Tax=Dichomitus squalens TaxID=114155 RepID=A0A4Q9MHR9_9APHY|nr:hypothetical protein BD311DRAFT_764586 [Dichomitus squalens]TBU43849.1 hypothetical protein BD309DRAFT_959617 [Dichomitus squalens]TBU56666.1 hypothetical protein BD310DRAFT_930804 [Dichomitus squalens]
MHSAARSRESFSSSSPCFLGSTSCGGRLALWSSRRMACGGGLYVRCIGTSVVRAF